MAPEQLGAFYFGKTKITISIYKMMIFLNMQNIIEKYVSILGYKKITKIWL